MHKATWAPKPNLTTPLFCVSVYIIINVCFIFHPFLCCCTSLKFFSNWMNKVCFSIDLYFKLYDFAFKLDVVGINSDA